MLWLLFEGCSNRAGPFSALYEKFPKWHFFNPCIKFENIFEPNNFFWHAMKVPFRDFIQNMSQSLFKCLNKLINWIISKSNHIWKILFVLGFKTPKFLNCSFYLLEYDQSHFSAGGVQDEAYECDVPMVCLVCKQKMKNRMIHKGPFIYYVITCRGGGGFRKCQFLIIFSTKNMIT